MIRMSKCIKVGKLKGAKSCNEQKKEQNQATQQCGIKLLDGVDKKNFKRKVV